jgi:hypothetical protein
MSQGKRYDAKERKEILEFLENHSYRETMDKYGVSQMSLARWVKNKRRRETLPAKLDEKIQEEIEIYLKLIENMEHVKATALITNGGGLILPASMDSREIAPNILMSFGLIINGFKSYMETKTKMGSGNESLIFELPLGGLIANLMEHMVLVTLVKVEPGNAMRDAYPVIEQIAKQISSLL